MRKFYSIFALCAFLFLSVSIQATDYTVEPTTAIKSNTLPLFRSSASMRGSIVQQIYLPSEFSPSGATAGNITAVTFYYAAKDANTAQALSRDVELWLMETDVDSYSLDKVSTTWNSKFLCNESKKAGTKVYDGVLQTNSVTSSDGVQTVKLTFDTPFSWDGTSNIVLTVYDKSTTNVGSNANSYLKFYITETTHARFVHQQWVYSAYSFTDDRADWMNNLDRYGYAYGSGVNDSIGYANKRNYVPKTTFSITPAAVVIPAPTNLSTTSVSTNSARLLWDAAAGATSYNVKWGTNSASLDHSATNVTNTYLDIDELEDGTTYYFAVQTATAGGTSAYTDPANFETTATTMEYKGIDFSKWTSTTTMPTAGAYYLRNDVGLSASVTLTDDLQLCLHGNTLYTSTYHIIVPDGKTLSIFNDTGDGLINGGFMENLGHGGIIEIQDGGTLIICEGQVMNIAGNDSYAIYNNGNLQLSGAPVIAGGSADIYLGNGKVITISGALSNSAPYSVQKALVGDFTSGWNTQMGSANPADYFSSANDTYGVVRNGNEARMVKVLAWSESTTNSSIGENSGQMVNASITRSVLTSASFNTICLPFALSNAQLEDIFGAGYDLEELVSSEIDGDILNLSFNKVTSLVAGKPYLLQPASDVTNPSFEGVTISATSPADQISDEFISFHGTFAPTELTGGNKNLLFLGAENELFWPASTGDIKGFRAYFEVKGAAQKAKAARIVKKEDQAQALDNIENTRPAQKRILNGQLVIEKNGTFYNAQGQIVK